MILNSRDQKVIKLLEMLVTNSGDGFAKDALAIITRYRRALDVASNYIDDDMYDDACEAIDKVLNEMV